MNIYVVYPPNGGPVQAFENRKDAEDFAMDDWKIACVTLNKHVVVKTFEEL